jgi:hypothetical protein
MESEGSFPFSEIFTFGLNPKPAESKRNLYISRS